MARGRKESDSGGLGSPGTCKEVSRWPGIARSRIVGAWGHLVSPRSCQGGQGAPGVGWWGPWVARWLPGAAKVARGHQESDRWGLEWPGSLQTLPRWPGGTRSWMEGAMGVQGAP